MLGSRWCQKLSTHLFQVIVGKYYVGKSVRCVFCSGSTVTFRTQDKCKHLLMAAGPVCGTALGKCLREHLRKHAHRWGVSQRGGWHLTHPSRPPHHHRHWYGGHVNRSVSQYLLSLTSWARLEASWHPETPNTCPLTASKIHAPLFLVACNPLIISVGWIWDHWVL